MQRFFDIFSIKQLNSDPLFSQHVTNIGVKKSKHPCATLHTHPQHIGFFCKIQGVFTSNMKK